MTKDEMHESEPLNIIMRYKAERTTIAEVAAEIRAYGQECARRVTADALSREHTGRLQAEHERDVLVEKLAQGGERS